MKIQVLIIYGPHSVVIVYGDAVILMNYQSLSTRWWAQVKSQRFDLEGDIRFRFGKQYQYDLWIYTTEQESTYA